jgi:hypothetical protein
MLKWANFFHLYQPPQWPDSVVRLVTREAYAPLVSLLKSKPNLKVTLNVTGALVENLERLKLHSVLTGFRKLAESGRVEFVGTLKYHPLMPTLSVTDARRQIELNNSTLTRVFGDTYRPVGFFPPEMAWHPKYGRLLKHLGFRWVLLDELLLGRELGQINPSKQFVTPEGLEVVLRNRGVSDYLAFELTRSRLPELPGVVRRSNGGSSLLITAMDGENLGHHRKGVRALWITAVAKLRARLLTVSELTLERRGRTVVRLRPGSWSSRKEELNHGTPFALWHDPKNTVHRLQWQLTHLATHVVRRHLAPGILRTFDEAVASDQYWWASAHPWWDPRIVERGARRLLAVITGARSTKAERARAHRLTNALVREAWLWHTSGRAQAMQREYIRATSAHVFLGGKRYGNKP